jgi:hypothetical protein
MSQVIQAAHARAVTSFLAVAPPDHPLEVCYMKLEEGVQDAATAPFGD